MKNHCCQSWRMQSKWSKITDRVLQRHVLLLLLQLNYSLSLSVTWFMRIAFIFCEEHKKFLCAELVNWDRSCRKNRRKRSKKSWMHEHLKWSWFIMKRLTLICIIFSIYSSQTKILQSWLNAQSSCMIDVWLWQMICLHQ